MNIGKEELLRINHGFGGNLRSDSSLDFAFHKLEDKKLGDYKKLAYLWRAILVDRPFSDANKRTVSYLTFAFAEEHKKQVDRDLMIHQIVSIAKKNITEIRNIERRIQAILK